MLIYFIGENLSNIWIKSHCSFCLLLKAERENMCDLKRVVPLVNTELVEVKRLEWSGQFSRWFYVRKELHMKKL